jgi:uncharacterized membrane protein HdeD (DUF308 family)
MTSPHEPRPGQPGQPGQAGQMGQTVAGPAAEPGMGVPPQATSSGAAGETVGYAVVGGPERIRRGTPLGADFAKSVWPAFLAAGLGCLAVGIILLVWPTATLVVAAILIGAALIVAGLLRLVHGFTARDTSGGARVGSVVIGLLAMVAGLYCIRHYHITIAILAIVVGLFWVMHGIAGIAAGVLGEPGSGRGITVLAGVLSLAAGLIVLFWPTISITILVVVMGIWLIVYGALMCVTAFQLRHVGKAADEAGDQGRLAPA